jgi:hypothetical protein
VWFVLVGALLVLAAVGLAQWWNRSAAMPAPRSELDPGPAVTHP